MRVTLAFLIVFVATGNADKEHVKFNLTVPGGPVSALLGASVTLPCAVSPTFSVVPLMMRWHRPKLFKTPVLLYDKKKIQQDPAGTGYRGRVSLVGSLEQGNVSIKLENITLADRGLYVCFVHSEVWFEEANVTLNVEVMGTLPLLSVSNGDTGQVKVSCTSDGWSPQPALTWTSGGGEKIKGHNTVYTTDDQGLVSVSSWLLHSPSESESVSCSVGLSDQKRKEGRVVPYVYTSHKGAMIGGIIFGVLVLILVPTAVIFCIKGSRKKKEEGSQEKRKKEDEGKENENLMEMKEKDDSLMQIENTTTRLKHNYGALMKLKKKIQDTQKLQVGEDRAPLNKLLKEHGKLNMENQKQTDYIKELKKEMDKVKRNMDQKHTGIDEMAPLQQKLDEIKNSVSDLEKKVAELQNQVAKKTRGLNKGKGGQKQENTS
ncbi:butyrophilin-like protein 10 [Alosa pseudoharengus]|uniref:butyrophilin-like protein 10 n=1 Tax=Alosa pseudoharengus TaxID=34774 RepID=UPI003F8B1AA5